MTVMKREHFAPILKEAVVLDLGDVAEQAAKITQAAEAKAKRLIAEAQAKAQGIVDNANASGFEDGHKQGVEQGYADGLEKGRAEAVQAMTAQLQQLEAAWRDGMAQWSSRIDAVEADARESVLQLALRLTAMLVHRVIDVDPTVIVDQVASALAFVLTASEVAVTIHPEDRAALEESMPQLAAEFGHIKRFKLAEDDSMMRGGCSVAYGQGRVDARLDQQLERIVNMLVPADIAEGEPTPPADAADTAADATRGEDSADRDADDSADDAAGDS